MCPCQAEQPHAALNPARVQSALSGWPLWLGKRDVVSVDAMRLDCPHSDGAPLPSMPQDLDAAVAGDGLGEDFLVGASTSSLTKFVASARVFLAEPDQLLSPAIPVVWTLCCEPGRYFHRPRHCICS